MDKTAVFLRIRALTHALDMIFSNADDGLSEDANTISMMLVELVDEYDRMRTAEGNGKWALIVVFGQCLIAWLAAFVVYHLILLVF